MSSLFQAWLFLGRKLLPLLQEWNRLFVIYSLSSSLVYYWDFEPSNDLGCPWMAKIWINSNTAEVLLKYKTLIFPTIQKIFIINFKMRHMYFGWRLPSDWIKMVWPRDFIHIQLLRVKGWAFDQKTILKQVCLRYEDWKLVVGRLDSDSQKWIDIRWLNDRAHLRFDLSFGNFLFRNTPDLVK
jgi:hypothetical protein